MREKQFYKTPKTEILEAAIEARLLDGSITASRSNYTMDAEDDWED